MQPFSLLLCHRTKGGNHLTIARKFSRAEINLHYCFSFGTGHPAQSPGVWSTEHGSQEQPKQYLFRCLFALTLMNLPLSIKPTSDATGVVCGHPGVLAGCRPVYSVRDCRKNNTPAPVPASKRMLLVSTQDDSASVTPLPFVPLLPFAPLVVCRNVRITIFIFDVY